jgi:hypothetical protein
MPRRILIVSPIPSHPQDQGNSARIFALGRALQTAGLEVHLLYWPMEGLAPGQHRAMARCWDGFHTLAPTPRDMRPTGAGFYRIDDWYDPAVSELARALQRRWRFSAVIANYVWFGAVLDAFGRDVVKILDTHDVFANRDRRMIEAGLKPEWFYTRPAEEARGLARADIVLAIQDEEAETLRGLGHRDVRALGHIAAPRTRLPRGGAGLTAGYLASGNPLNVGSFNRLHAHLAKAALPDDMTFLVAGTICPRLPPLDAPFRAIGPVDHVESFYEQVDLVVNPMTGGTGLKIKSVEAVCEGLPLLATADAMLGLPAEHRFHRFATPEALADRLAAGLDAATLASLAAASRRCAALYSVSVREALRELVRAIGAA